jgi:phosphate transport system permease protein
MTARTQEKLALTLITAATCITVVIMLAIVLRVWSNGIGHIDLEFLTQPPRSMGREGGIWSTIVSTVMLAFVALLIASPVGIGAGIYLTEYMRHRQVLAAARFGIESLAGVPSIVFGLFGFTFFVLNLGMGWSVLSGGLTLALMVLPTIVRTTEETLRAVPREYREGSLALGATRWQTTARVVLPSAFPGITTGIILSIGRAVGETAAVLLTAGSALGVPRGLGDPARSMAVHLYILAAEGLSMERAYATGSVLILLIMVVNWLANHQSRRHAGKGRI